MIHPDDVQAIKQYLQATSTGVWGIVLLLLFHAWN